MTSGPERGRNIIKYLYNISFDTVGTSERENGEIS